MSTKIGTVVIYSHTKLVLKFEGCYIKISRFRLIFLQKPWNPLYLLGMDLEILCISFVFPKQIPRISRFLQENQPKSLNFDIQVAKFWDQLSITISNNCANYRGHRGGLLGDRHIPLLAQRFSLPRNHLRRWTHCRRRGCRRRWMVWNRTRTPAGEAETIILSVPSGRKNIGRLRNSGTKLLQTFWN